MSEIRVIGVSGQCLDERQRALLAGCNAVATAARHTALLGDFAGGQIPLAPLDGLFDRLDQALTRGNVAVLASGDPLFFGIGRRLLAAFAPEQLRFFPAVSALQLACARFKIPWDDLPVLSLHGRAAGDVAGQILGHRRVLLLTDPVHSPDAIARLLRDCLKGAGDGERLRGLRLRVAENLGLAGERVHDGGVDEIAAGGFSPLNVLLVEQVEQKFVDVPFFGLREDEIVHHRGLITKDEVRAVILHQLRLPASGFFWDIGGGSGSISLEAAVIAPGLSIFCVEKKEEGQEAIRRNIAFHGRYRVHLASGEAPDVLTGLPAPDRIFIGGSGGRLAEIIHAAAARLSPSGIMVVSAVLPESAELAPRCLVRAGLRVSQRRVRVERLAEDGVTWRQHNPITIITGYQ